MTPEELKDLIGDVLDLTKIDLELVPPAEKGRFLLAATDLLCALPPWALGNKTLLIHAFEQLHEYPQSAGSTMLATLNEVWRIQEIMDRLGYKHE